MAIDVNVLTNFWTIIGVVASFLVAFVALGLGIKSIYEMRYSQKIEYREKVLDKISDWLIDITKLKNAGDFVAIPELKQFFADVNQAKLGLSLETWNKQEECFNLANEGRIITTNFQDKEKPLPKAVGELILKMEALSNLNRQYSLKFPNLPENITIMDVLALLGKYNTDCHSIHTEKQKYIGIIINEVAKLKYTKPLS